MVSSLTSTSNQAEDIFGSRGMCDSNELRDKIGGIFTCLHNTGHFLVDHGHYDEAIRCFQALSQGDDSYENGAYAYGLGRAWEGKGDLKVALDWYRIAYENNPPVPEFEAGIRRATAALEAAGGTAEDGYRYGDYAFSRGRYHEASGAFAKARQWYRIAFQGNPAVPEFRMAHERLIGGASP